MIKLLKDDHTLIAIPIAKIEGIRLDTEYNVLNIHVGNITHSFSFNLIDDGRNMYDCINDDIEKYYKNDKR